jgi:hypothetical protein
MLKCWKILILLFCFCTSILAQTLKPPFSSDRFYQLPSPELMPRGQFQIESGFLFEKDRPGDAYLNSVNHNTSLIRYGLSEEIEVRLGAGFILQQTENGEVLQESNGIVNMLVSSKIFVTREAGIIPQSAVLLDLYIPVRARDNDSDNLKPDVIYVTTNQPVHWLRILSNIGMRFFDQDTHVFHYGVGAGFYVIPKIAVFIQPFGKIPVAQRAAHSISFGMMYRILTDLQLDTSYGLGLNDQANDQFFNIGVCLRFPE